MKKNLFNYVLVVLLSLLSVSTKAQIFPIEQLAKGFTINSTPTVTFLWESSLKDEAKGTFIFIPGGDGNVGMKAGWTEEASGYLGKYHFLRTLKRLSDKDLTTGSFNVVVFDNPTNLGLDRYPSQRTTADHMTRIESVVTFYADKLKKPIWLFGHSNGGFSIAEFHKYLEKKYPKSNIVNGWIFSAGRDISSFGTSFDAPFLFVHSENDNCSDTTPAGNVKIFNSVKAVNRSVSQLTLIKTSQSEAKNPCLSGIHMYYGAGNEVAKVLEDFMLNNSKSK
jgi:hypothetical protein